ncbi:hypothetical protein [Metabacillus malikii]|uniref:Uncharacterized protein n=1 Tax=Metabacillus malikii TaxID=1504265 RepID=A0ABT9ZCH6_9BACI|nr:hypothetical protein [Metabacillus malikii]MDQ0229964.1 hypothetical protein [Metabacillus malikii]
MDGNTVNKVDPQVGEERLLRFAAPALYKKMVEVFSKKNIHPYDIYATAKDRVDGLTLTISLSQSLSAKPISADFSFDQANNPDERVETFFQETVETCKQQLISEYFKMIKL